MYVNRTVLLILLITAIAVFGARVHTFIGFHNGG